MGESSTLRLHAERELDAIGETGAMRDHLLRMVDAFAAEGHSGFSAAHAANALNKLFRFEPLAPLSGDDSEWMEVSDDLWQNTRCSHVFKNSGGAYDIQGRVFREPNGVCFTNCESSTPVTFPYTPTTEYIDVAEGGEPLESPPRPEPVAWALCDDGGVFDVEPDEATAKEWVRGGADCGLVRWLRPLVFGDVARPSAAAGAEVVELDEWRVVDSAGGTYGLWYNKDRAQHDACRFDARMPNTAPHRVMRVCLKEVE